MDKNFGISLGIGDMASMIHKPIRSTTNPTRLDIYQKPPAIPCPVNSLSLYIRLRLTHFVRQ